MHIKAFQMYFLLGLIALTLVLSYKILAPFLAPLALGTIFAVVLQPVYHRVVSLVRGRRSLASFLTVLVSVVVLLVPLSLIGAQLFSEARELYGSSNGRGSFSVSSIVEGMIPSVSEYIPGSAPLLEQFSAEVDAYARSALTWLVQHLGTAFSSAAALVLNFFIFLITLYYLLKDGPRLKRLLVQLSPLPDTKDEAVARELSAAVNSVIKGMLLVALIQGCIAGVGYFLFGVPNVVLLGVMTAIAALVPVFGTSLIIAPAVIYLALTGDFAQAIGLAVWGAAAVGLVDNFVGPRLMSGGMKLHPLLVLLSVLGGLALFGPIGIFLGPLSLSFLLALLSLYAYLTAHGVIEKSGGDATLSS